MTILTVLLEILGLFILVFLLFWIFIKYIRAKTNFDRSLNMTFMEIRTPKNESKEDRELESETFAGKDFKEASNGVMNQFFDTLFSLYSSKFKKLLTEQDHVSFEYAVYDGLIHFYIVCPSDLVNVIEKQITAFYPQAFIDIVEDYNIFSPDCQVAACYLTCSKEFFFPLKTYNKMTIDPVNGIVNSLSKIGKDEGASVQIMIRPKKSGWQKQGREMANKLFQNKKIHGRSWYNPLAWVSGFFDLMFRGEKVADKEAASERNTPMTEEEIKSMEEKNSKQGYETIIRLVSVAKDKSEAEVNLSAMKSAFTQFSSTNGNSFSSTSWHNVNKLISNYIFRNFVKPVGSKLMVLSTEELASIFHVPNIRYNKFPAIAWQNYKIAPAPNNIPSEGLLLGHNIYRGQKKEIRLKREDRFRHFYSIGQTGTGKTSIFQVMIRQDLLNGDGICVVDPHGSLIEDILPFIPRERADDVIYFDPSDVERPLGLNLLEAKNWDEAEMVALDAMNIMIKLFDEEVFGPRIQDYFRNGCLTLMSDPAGGSLTDIVRLFTDDDFAKYKRQFVTNPVVASFWDHQMAKTGAREKQEMIPYFAAKFGQFVTNSMIRNIIGQAKSAFDFYDVMQSGKILLMNLSKGTTGEINSRLLGLIIIQKIQMAALKRQKVEKEKRKDFFLYIDEFQNYVTESIESILSEARKYRLGLNITHQYIAQLEGSGSSTKKGVNLKDAIFGNVGSMMCYKIGAQDAEVMAKEMAPVFSDQDLINLDKYKAAIKISIDTQPSRPFSIIPINPYTEVGDKDAADAYKQLSRLKYGRDRDFVDREILRRIGAI